MTTIAELEAKNRLKSEEKRSRHNDDERTALAYEYRETEGGMTSIGRMRRFFKNHSQNGAAFLLRSQKLVAAFVAIDSAHQWQQNFNAITADGVQTFPFFLQETLAMVVDDRLDPDNTVAFTDVLVADEIADRLDAEVSEVRDQKKIIDARHDAGEHGPFGAHFAKYNLEQEFRLRHDEKQDIYAHDALRVAALHKEVVCDIATGRCTTVFHVTAAPGTSRHQKIEQDEPEQISLLAVQAEAEQVNEVRHTHLTLEHH